MKNLTPDALATYTARYRETYADDPHALHKPSMRVVVEMVIDRCAKEAHEKLTMYGARVSALAAETAILSLKGPRP